MKIQKAAQMAKKTIAPLNEFYLLLIPFLEAGNPIRVTALRKLAEIPTIPLPSITAAI